MSTEEKPTETPAAETPKEESKEEVPKEETKTEVPKEEESTATFEPIVSTVLESLMAQDTGNNTHCR
jgi:hypothetical protein